MKSKLLFNVGAATLFVLIVLGLLTPASGPKRAGKIVQSKLEMSDLNAATAQYHNEYGSYLTGNSANIIQCLLGNNLRKIEFLSFNTNRFDSNGDFLDPWLTPYRIEILAQTNLVVRSAGPNKKFGDADDIVFNSVSNDFVKP
jgi:hypothetical protein